MNVISIIPMIVSPFFSVANLHHLKSSCMVYSFSFIAHVMIGRIFLLEETPSIGNVLGYL